MLVWHLLQPCRPNAYNHLNALRYYSQHCSIIKNTTRKYSSPTNCTDQPNQTTWNQYKKVRVLKDFDHAKKSHTKQTGAGPVIKSECRVLGGHMLWCWTWSWPPDESKRMMHHRSWDARQPNTQETSKLWRCGKRSTKWWLGSKGNGRFVGSYSAIEVEKTTLEAIILHS